MIGMAHFPTGGSIAWLTRFSIFLLSSLGPSVVKFLGPGLLCFWHRLDQQRERLAEAGSSVRFASIVPETHDDEIMRGNHQRRLPAGARHVTGIARDWILPVAVEPEESSIDR